ncbi:Serine/threonine-protein kinase PrkC [uncultured Roseburia sp.]|uniref:non-specific serine/threonine protein kinase n=1 Tax=Brotonthovivens ammoniilytica TaxID=2981725 RepID=A0ABT2TJ68_9FIRM|nr:serine/threonine-protein kinase [Brotonthovivens ammoniilytica]MCU6762263.1 serine/threonine protein kinase [Brotonthovivens ammoniilytica]SCI60605.1 Serine/threonine-protein kinase PrkC [uncultured Roseburia sp.]
MNIVGQVINGYLFEEALGSGSFGAVYRVSKENNVYAAKVLSETYILDEFKNEQNRITREIDVLKNVKGENLIKYQEDFYFKNEFGIMEYVIVMEYFHGKTLRSFLRNDVELETLIRIFVSVLYGVRDLHNTIIENAGIIHRDLKPDNIMIDDNLNVKIIDYGLSKIIDFSSITSTGTQIGSPLYMSPEQLKDSKHIDCRADIYALGIILYEMLTKNVPYKASTLPELLMKILNDPIIPPKQYNPTISDGLENIIFKATAKESFVRFQTVDEFIDAFDKKNIQEELVTVGKYYAWVYREKDVTEQFEKVNKADIIYPIHVQNWMKKLHLHFANNNFENVIIDPSTQRLSYVAFGNTKGLVELPYAPEKGVISLEYLHNPQKRKEYIDNWYATVSIGQKLILPYHYISNTDYPVEKVDDWIRMNIQLIDESARVVEEGKEKYAMISIGLGHLVFQADKILSYFVHAKVDGFIVQVSDMKQLNEQSLGSYLEFMVNLQKYTSKPVIALKVPIPLGLTLIAKGIHGFSLGLASIDYFDEQYIKEEKDSFNLYSKFYFPQVLSFLTYPKKDTFAFEQIYNYFGGCNCKWCNGKTAIEIGTGDKGVQLHHWQMMIEEVDNFNQYEGEERIAYLRERIDVALKNLDSIPKEIMGSQKNTDYYKLLKNLKRIV